VQKGGCFSSESGARERKPPQIGISEGQIPSKAAITRQRRCRFSFKKRKVDSFAKYGLDLGLGM